jgi:hypothetical protein
MFNPTTGWLVKGDWMLLAFGAAMQVLVIWMVVEAVLAWRNARSEGLLGEAQPDAATPAAREDA